MSGIDWLALWPAAADVGRHPMRPTWRLLHFVGAPILHGSHYACVHAVRTASSFPLDKFAREMQICKGVPSGFAVRLPVLTRTSSWYCAGYLTSK